MQRDAAAGNDAFFDGRARRMQRIFDAGLLLFHFDFGRRADFDRRDAAGQLGQTLLQLLAVVVGSGVFDLRADLLTRPSMSAFLPAPSTIVVLSLSMITSWRGRDRSSVTFSSLMPSLRR